jgi:hypothetical protein
MLGWTLVRLGQLHAGVQHLDLALRLAPTYPAAYFAKGMALLKSGAGCVLCTWLWLAQL